MKVMQFVQNKQRQNNNELVVITIMGPKRSGKSTLINHMFGTKLDTRLREPSTSGVTATLIRTDIPGTKEILLLDTNGLFEIDTLES